MTGMFIGLGPLCFFTDFPGFLYCDFSLTIHGGNTQNRRGPWPKIPTFCARNAYVWLGEDRGWWCTLCKAFNIGGDAGDGNFGYWTCSGRKRSTEMVTTAQGELSNISLQYWVLRLIFHVFYFFSPRMLPWHWSLLLPWSLDSVGIYRTVSICGVYHYSLHNQCSVIPSCGPGDGGAITSNPFAIQFEHFAICTHPRLDAAVLDYHKRSQRTKGKPYWGCYLCI